jgi:hypothetical protein
VISVFEPNDAGLLAQRARDLPRRGAEIRYLVEFLQQGPRALIDAADLPRLVLQLGEDLVPVVVNDDRESLCYFLSPHVHYVEYMREELAKMHGNFTARLMSSAVGFMGRVAAPLGFNRCVSVNNWLFTTSQSLALLGPALGELTQWLTRRFVDLPLVFRGIDLRPPEVRATFEAAGYLLVVNRPVFEVDVEKLAKLPNRRRRRIRQELKLLDDPRFVISFDDRLAPGEEARITYLYRRLYLEKHSRFNARYTPAYFRALADAGVERFVTLRWHDELLAFGTIRPDGPRQIFALVGYDVDKPPDEFPLYRTIVAASLRTAIDSRRLCFWSTGNANFKTLRGGYEWIEYEGVYQRHLALHRQLPWWMFKTAFDRALANLDTRQI